MIMQLSSSSKVRPKTLSAFKKIGKRRLGRSPQECFDLHEKRKSNKPAPAMVSIIKFLKLFGHLQNLWQVKSTEINSFDHTKFITLPIYDGFPFPEKSTDSRKRNWEDDISSFGESGIETINKGRYSSRCTYNHYGYNRVIHSMACVISERYVYFRIDTKGGLKTKIVKAPRGWKWNIDKFGLRIVSNKNNDMDYHPSANDIINNYDSIALSLASIAKDKYKERKLKERLTRLAAKQQERIIKKATKDGVCLRFIDSIDAGNCHTGTMGFTNRYFPGRKYVTIKEMVSHINRMDGDLKRRVTLTIAQAIRRHREDCARGYCTIKRT